MNELTSRAGERPVGFSTGCLHHNVDNTYAPEAVELLASKSLAAVEVMCAYGEHVRRLPAMVPALEDFAVKSIHLPVYVRYTNTKEIRLMLRAIEKFYLKIGASLAVIHPDLVDDWQVFQGREMCFAIENMDMRKSCFQRPEEFVDFFAIHPDWKFVLDINHCYVHDKSLALVDQFMKSCGKQLAEIHISGVGVDGYHKPLYLTRQAKLVNKIPNGPYPIIIESPCHPTMLAAELSYLRHRLKA